MTTELIAAKEPFITFSTFNNDEPVGSLHFGKTGFTFSGDADESAKVLFQAVQMNLRDYVYLPLEPGDDIQGMLQQYFSLARGSEQARLRAAFNRTLAEVKSSYDPSKISGTRL